VLMLAITLESPFRGMLNRKLSTVEKLLGRGEARPPGNE